MDRFIYTNHLKLRLQIRKIPKNYPKLVYRKPDQKYYDALEGKFIAVKKLRYNKKLRHMMIAYEEKGGFSEIVTIHPITEEKIINRIVSKRWIKNG